MKISVIGRGDSAARTLGHTTPSERAVYGLPTSK